MPSSEHRLLRALRRQTVDCTPIWIMRQAGRYLPEYRETRSRAGSFIKLCKTPELACEVTLQPLRRFALDAAIIFSDILTIPDAMGLGLSVEEGIGPRFERPLRSAADIARLGVPDPQSDLRYVMDAIALVSRELGGKVPLIGFSGSPWTLASYMVEGGGSANFHRIKCLMFDNAADAHRLLQVLATAVQGYLEAQIAVGARVVMIFDTWGGALSSSAYREFSLAYLQQIVAGLKASAAAGIPVILFTKGGGLWLEDQIATGCDAVGLDWTIDIGTARERAAGRVALQGNLDPAVLCAEPEAIRREAAAVLNAFGEGSGHVFNLGHGVTPDVPPEHVGLLVDTVHELSRRS
jgi:uroporphyrinogen decarboxylase